jgi:Ser/Thr protein kinase RdoA (MazF antagonist)
MIKVYHSVPTIEFLSSVIEKQYGIKVAKIYLYRELGGSLYYVTGENRLRYVLKIYKCVDTAEALQAAEIMQFLADRDFPTAPIMKTKSDTLCGTISMPEYEVKAVLYEFIEGEYPDEADNMPLIAKQVADMHRLMKDYPKEIKKQGKKKHIDDAVSLWGEYFPHRASDIDELAAYGEVIWNRVEQLPSGFCHDDLHNNNMMLRNGSIYFFDFDSASIEHPMFDAVHVCDCMDFWTVQEKHINNTYKLLEKFATEYNKHGHLSDKEISSYFYCLAVRHYRLHGVSSRIPIKGSAYITEQWFDNLIKWLHDFRELTEKLFLI